MFEDPARQLDKVTNQVLERETDSRTVSSFISFLRSRAVRATSFPLEDGIDFQSKQNKLNGPKVT